MRLEVLITLLLSLSLVACGDDEDPADPGEDTTEEVAEEVPPRPCVPGCARHRRCDDGTCVPAHPQIALEQQEGCVLHEGRSTQCWGDRGEELTELDGAATEIAIGAATACALLESGEVRCGLLDGETETIAGLREPSRLTVGYARGCVIEGEGAVACWSTVQGHERTVHRFEGVADARQVVSRNDFLCVRFEDGAVACTDDAACAARDCLRDVTGAEGVADLALSGTPRGCSVLVDGTVACFNLEGQSALAARSVAGITGARHIAMGLSHACVLDQDGAVRCFGSNGDGQLGTGTMALVSSLDAPALGDLGDLVGEAIDGLSGVVSLSAAGSSTCAVTEADRILCWGSDEAVQRLRPELAEPSPAHRIEGVTDATGVAMGHDVACAVRGDSEPLCWGRPRLGESGGVVWAAGDGLRVMWTPTDNDRGLTPTEGDLVPSAPQLPLGDSLSCSLASGALACANPRTPLDTQLLAATRRTPRLTDPVSLGRTVCGLDPSNAVVCVGPLPRAHPLDAMLGGDRFFDPESHEGESLFSVDGRHLVYRLGGLPGPIAAVAGRDSVFAIGADRRVFSWTGETAPRWVAVEGLDEVQQLAFSANHFCARRTDGSLACGALHPMGPRSAEPREGVSDARHVAAGFDSFCVAHLDGHVSCFGRNDRGVLGTLPAATPAEVRAELQRPPD